MEDHPVETHRKKKKKQNFLSHIFPVRTIRNDEKRNYLEYLEYIELYSEEPDIFIIRAKFNDAIFLTSTNLFLENKCISCLLLSTFNLIDYLSPYLSM